MASCVVNPGVVNVSLDQTNNIIIISPVDGGKSPLASIFVNNKSSPVDEEEKKEWADETVN